MTHVIQSLGFERKHVPWAVLTGFGESYYLAGLVPMKSKKPIFALPGQGDRLYGCSDKNDLIMGMPGPMIFYLNTFLFKSGGDEYNLKNLLENPEPLEDLDESSRRGWAYVRKLIKALCSEQPGRNAMSMIDISYYSNSCIACSLFSFMGLP